MNEEYDSTYSSGTRDTGRLLRDVNQDELDALSSLLPTTNQGVYVGWDNAAPVDDFDMISQSDDAFVYGLNTDNRQDPADAAGPSRGIPMPLIVLASLLVVVGLVGFGAWTLFGKKKEQTVEVPVEQKVEKKETVEETKPKALITTDVQKLVCDSLTYEGQSVTLESSQASVVIHNGKVMVMHRLPADAQVVPQTAVRMAGIRSNVTASLLTDKEVAGDGENPAVFNELIWVLLDNSGDAFIVVSEGPGTVRTSSAQYGVLAGANAYAMSESLYKALGDNPGIEATKGNHPNDPYGTRIEVVAELPKTEETEKEDEDKKNEEDKDSKEEEEEKTSQTNSNSNSNSNKSNNSSNSSSNGSSSSSGGGNSSGGGSSSGGGNSSGGDSGSSTTPTTDEPTVPDDGGSGGGSGDTGGSGDSGGSGDDGGGGDSSGSGESDQSSSSSSE